MDGCEEDNETAIDAPSGRLLLLPIVTFVLSLVVPTIGSGLFGGSVWFWALLGATIGALSLSWFNTSYRVLIDPTQLTDAAWLRRFVPQAVAAIVVALVGAVLMAIGADRHSLLLVAVGLGPVLGGVVVVAQVVGADINRTPSDDPPDTLLPNWQVWALNAALVLGVTLLPSLVLGWWLRGLALGSVVLPWLLAVWLRRRRLERWVGVLGLVLVAAPLAATLFLDRDRRIAPALLWLGAAIAVVGLVVLSTQQRTDSAVRFAGDRFEEKRRALVVVAVLCMVVGAGLLIYQLRGPGIADWVVAALILGSLLAGASLVLRGEGFVLLALIGLALVWTVRDHSDGPQLRPPVDTTKPVLLAFGDSYMSGEGVGQFYDDTNYSGRTSWVIDDPNPCRRSPSAYGPLLAEQLDITLWFDACSGANAMSDELADAVLRALADEGDEFDLSNIDLDDVLVLARQQGEAAKNTIIGQLIRWRDLGADSRPDPTAVLLSLGGNDAGFSTIGAACFLPGSCQAALDGRDDTALDSVTARVAIALALVAGDFPKAQLGVVAYPQMFGDAADACTGQIPFDGDEVRRLATLVTELNDAVDRGVQRVAESRAEGRLRFFRSSEDAFDGSRFCQEAPGGGLVKADVVNTAYFQAFDSPNLLSRVGSQLINNTFHPTAQGHRRLAAALRADVGSLLQAPAPAPIDDRTGGDPAASADDATAEPVDISAEALDAPEGVCGDLDNYIYCSLVATAQLVVLPIGLLGVAGAVIGWMARPNVSTLRKRIGNWLSRLVPRLAGRQ